MDRITQQAGFSFSISLQQTQGPVQAINSAIKFRFLVIASIIALAISGIYAAIGLYADGSYFLHAILQSNGFYDFYKEREFSQLITQAPVVFALKAGVKDLNLLIRFHSFGLIAIPIMFWILALIIQLKTDLFWFFVTAFSVTYLSSGFYAIGEYNLPYSMAALSASLLLRDKMGTIGLISLILISFGITLTYESMVLLGPLLVGLCIIHLIATNKCSVFYKISVMSSMLFFAVSSFTSLCSIIFAHDAGSSPGSAFADMLEMLISIHFIFLLIMGCLFVSSLFFAKKRILMLAWMISIIHLIDIHFWNLPIMHYKLRIPSGLLLSLVIAVSAFYYFSRKNMAIFKNNHLKPNTIPFVSYLSHIMNEIILKINQSRSNPFPMLLFVTLIIPFYIQIIGFYNWASIFEQETTMQTGLIPINKTQADHSIYNWNWSNPSLSLVLRGNKAGATILNNSQYKGWQPFTPKNSDDHVLRSFPKKAPYYHSRLT